SRDPKSPVIGGEAHNLTQGFVGAPFHQLAPGRLGVVADTDNSAAIGSGDLRRPYLKIMIRLPPRDVARILGIQPKFARIQVDPVDVKYFGITLVQLDQDRV